MIELTDKQLHEINECLASIVYARQAQKEHDGDEDLAEEELCLAEQIVDVLLEGFTDEEN